MSSVEFNAAAPIIAKNDVKAFDDRLAAMASQGLLSAGIAFGRKLGLFDALIKISDEDHPVTPCEVAEVAGCKPRFVDEWLSLMASGRVIDVTPEEKYYVKRDLAPVFRRESCAVAMHAMMPNFMKCFEKLENVFKKDGPRGLSYADYSGFYVSMEGFAVSMHAKHLVEGYIKRLAPDMQERLEQGITCLDVGCGKGFHLAVFAEMFPNSTFTGIDFSSDAIEHAVQKRRADGSKYENLEYRQMDALHLDPTWSEKFDVAFNFEACHDQFRPDQELLHPNPCFMHTASEQQLLVKYLIQGFKEVHRVLKKGGIYGILEVVGTGNVFDDLNEKDKTCYDMSTVLPFCYGFSMFHCVAVGSNSDDTMCLGAMCGASVFRKLLTGAGFEVEVIATPEFFLNQLYRCQKI